MKLKLSSGSITEDINLVASAPARPYLEVKENNNIVGYARLSNSGRGKFTFNNMHIQSMPQYIYVGSSSSNTKVFDINLNEKGNIAADRTTEYGFRGYTDYDVYTISGDLNGNARINHINTENNNIRGKYAKIYLRNCTVDTRKNMYALITNFRDKIYSLDKVSENGSLIWGKSIPSYQKIEIDGMNQIYLQNDSDKKGESFNTNGTRINSFTLNGVIHYVSKTNKIFAVRERVLYVYNNNFQLLQSISLNYEEGDIIYIFCANNTISLLSKQLSKFYLSKYNFTKNNFDFRNVLISKMKGSVIDAKGNVFVLDESSIEKYDNTGKRTSYKSITNPIAIAINGDRE